MALSSFAAAQGLQAVPSVDAGALTPLLVESGAGRIAPAARGQLADGVSGALGQLIYTRNKKFHFAVALTEVPASTPFVPRLFCVRTGRRTRDDEYYGFEPRFSKLWTESTALNERFHISTSPYQDQNWLRQLFSPAFVDWIASKAPPGFSFELAYGSAEVARRIARECEE